MGKVYDFKTGKVISENVVVQEQSMENNMFAFLQSIHDYIVSNPTIPATEISRVIEEFFEANIKNTAT